MADDTVPAGTAPASTHKGKGRTIWFRVTPTIERDYARRGIFPELRVAKAPKTEAGGTVGIIPIPESLAREVLADAERMRQDRTLPKGTPKAFTSVFDRLSCALGPVTSKPSQAASTIAGSPFTAREERAMGRADALREQAKDAQLAAELAGLPKTADEFKKAMRTAVRHALFHALWKFGVFKGAPGGRAAHESGFYLSDSSRAEIESLTGALASFIEHEAEIRYSEARRLPEAKKMLLEAAQLDAPLQRVLRNAMAADSSGLDD